MGFQPTWGRKREESGCDRNPERFLTSISIMAVKKLPCLRAYIYICVSVCWTMHCRKQYDDSCKHHALSMIHQVKSE